MSVYVTNVWKLRHVNRTVSAHMLQQMRAARPIGWVCSCAEVAALRALRLAQLQRQAGAAEVARRQGFGSLSESTPTSLVVWSPSPPPLPCCSFLFLPPPLPHPLS